MTEPIFPVALAAKLRQSVNFDTLSEWADVMIQKRRIQLETDLDLIATAHVRGQIATLKSLKLLGDKCEEITRNA